MDVEAIYNVVCKLVGPIEPVGDTVEDDKRLTNLKVMIKVSTRMLTGIGDVSREQYSVAASKRRAGIRADKYLKSLGK